MKIKTLTREEAEKYLNGKIIETGFAQTPAGMISITRTDGMITAVDFVAAKCKPDAWAQKIADDFFAKQKTDESFLLVGTEFQLAVWKALAGVPWGKTVTYGELAGLSGRPKASRAVGNAMNKNPIPIFIPCHRVLAGGNKIGGYGGGLSIKKILLEKEGVLNSVKIG